MATKKQLGELRRADNHPLGVVEPHHTWQGLQRATWHAGMSRMVSAGWFRRYLHGGYVITDEGRAVLVRSTEKGSER